MVAKSHLSNLQNTPRRHVIAYDPKCAQGAEKAAMGQTSKGIGKPQRYKPSLLDMTFIIKVQHDHYKTNLLLIPSNLSLGSEH